MRQSNLTRFSFFIPVLLMAVLFVYTSTINFAQNQNSKLPGCIQELLTGKTSEISSALSQLSDSDLPAALASIELLKFKALHNEISLTSKDVSTLKMLITNRIDKSSTVSFTETDSCKQKVAEAQISFDGQNISVPQYFIADEKLSIIACTPNCEAGSIFPEFTVEFFSKTVLKKQSLTIDGKEYSTYRLVTEGSPLIFSPDIIPDNMLSIGTHTAKITLKNKDGETVSKKWHFTVGVKDISTPPLPDSAVVVKELDVNPEKFLPKQKLNGKLSVIVYRDKNGKIYTEYKLKTPSGQVIKSRNLAFITRRAIADGKSFRNMEMFPKTYYAFKGNIINFSYKWTGNGTIKSEKWDVTSGTQHSTSNSIEMSGYTNANCTLTIERTYIDSDGVQQTYEFEESNTATINLLVVSTSIFEPFNNLSLANVASKSFKLDGGVSCPDIGEDPTNEGGVWDLAEGKVYSLYSGEAEGTLSVNKLRWKLQASEGSPKILNPLASETLIMFDKPGYAEVIFDIGLTWSQFGESYQSAYKPDLSKLCAFYPAKAKAHFKKYPEGILFATRRHIQVESYDLEIKDQKRTLKSGTDFELSQPIEICKSDIWPASSPIRITRAELFLSENDPLFSLGQITPFTFLTPAFVSEGECHLGLTGVFENIAAPEQKNNLVINELPSIPVYDVNKIIDLQLDPSEKITIPEGKETKFSASVVTGYNIGTGELSESEDSLNILDGYKLSSVKDIFWYEDWGDDDWKDKAEHRLEYTHIFDPVIGTGAYTMNCVFELTLKESDTGDEIPAGLFTSVPVDVTPGLHIFSPFETMIYPLCGRLRVDTSMDSEENLPDWQKITWKLNGKDYKPDTAAPHFFIELDHTGDWLLEAELKKKDPITGEDMILKDSVEFSVKPIDIRLAPSRKLIDFSKNKFQNLSLSIAIDGETAEKPGDHLPWDGDFIEAVVDKVEWSVVDDGSDTPAKNFTSLDTKPDSFDAVLNFTKTGAATVQASVTIKLVGAEKLFLKKYPKYKYEFVLPVFNLPAARADVWAKNPPEWHNFNGKTAARAIQNTTRLFSANSGEVEFDGKPYDWNKTDDFGGKIKVSTALLGGVPLTSTNLNFSWEGPDGQTSEKTEFKPNFSTTGAPEVVMNSSIEFGSGNSLSFNQEKTKVKVKPLSEVINCSVTANPSNVKVNVPSTVSFKFGEITGVINSQTKLDIWDGEYNIKLDNLSWKANDASLPDSSPTIQFSGSSHGEYIISAKPEFTVKPINCDATPATLDPVKTSVRVIGSLLAWKVNGDLADHLDRIRKAVKPMDDIYTEAKHSIWNSDGKQYPLVVGCDSSVELTPIFSSSKPKEQLEVAYLWLNESGGVDSENTAELNNSVSIPTPSKIGKYQLRLTILNISEPVLISEVYTVKKITPETAEKAYYMKCIQDSVNAFEPNGFNVNTVDKTLVDDFYNWWWTINETLVSVYKNKLEYAIKTDHNAAYEVINHGGGYCEALGNYYFKCLECQGIKGIKRLGIRLQNKLLISKTSQSSLRNTGRRIHYPYQPEYWGAIFFNSSGLNHKEALFYLPLPDVPGYEPKISPYKRYAINEYTGSKKLPLQNVMSVEVDLDKNVNTHEKEYGYTFDAPDGHATVLYTDEISGKTYLYDPSFEHKEMPFVIPFVPPAKKIVLKNILTSGVLPLYERMCEYISLSTIFRGFTFCKSSSIPYGMTIIDLHQEQLNYLEVEFTYYTSREE